MPQNKICFKLPSKVGIVNIVEVFSLLSSVTYINALILLCWRA